MSPLLDPQCNWWSPGDPTSYALHDEAFMTALVNAGYSSFTCPGGLFGAMTDARAVLVIHRGGSRRWELILQEGAEDVLATFTTDLAGASRVAVSWLRGGRRDEISREIAALAIWRLHKRRPQDKETGTGPNGAS